MAVESFTARVTENLTAMALRMRQPARRFIGSVHSSVTIFAIIIGAYNLLVGSIYSWNAWNYGRVSTLVQTNCGFAFVTAIFQIALIFGMLTKEDKVLKYVLCATMAVCMVCVPLSVCTFLGVAIRGYYDIPVWETPRLILYLVHLGLMYCLLAELNGDPLPPLAATPPPTDGWLKNNLSNAGLPPTPGADDALLKVQVESNNSASPRINNNNNNSGGGPAVFTPSSCTTAPPVHPAVANTYPAAAVHPAVANTYPAAAVPGPPSTSEA